MKAIFCGSRKFRAMKKVEQRIDDFVLLDRNVIVKTGGASGPDTRAYQYAKKRGLQVDEPVTPKFGEIHDNSIYFDRNDEMLDDPEVKLVICFWNGSSKGTGYMVKEAMRRKINFEVIYDD